MAFMNIIYGIISIIVGLAFALAVINNTAHPGLVTYIIAGFLFIFGLACAIGEFKRV